MKLDNQTLTLIAVGASVAANCQPCLEHNAGLALKCGAGDQEIAEAIEIGKRVRHGAASKMDRFALRLNHSVSSSANSEEEDCGCSL